MNVSKGQTQRWISCMYGLLAKRLSINVTKTNYMFENRKLNTSISIKINKEALGGVEVTKCLGILIDDKLTWKNHISLVKSKLSKCCAIM